LIDEAQEMSPGVLNERKRLARAGPRIACA
jgi:hypothetical protein